jgi:hypothetical protein
MAQTIKLKRSATSGAVPTTGSLELGEVAINTYDGKMYIKKNDGTESVVEIGTLTGNVSFGDNVKATFGAGSDLQIYHDGTHSYVSDQGTGNLRVLAENFQVRNPANNEAMIIAIPDSGVTLYHDNSAKLATTATGINVTGTATMDGLTVEGNTYIDTNNGADAFYVTRYGNVQNESASFVVNDDALTINSIQDEQYGSFRINSTRNGVGTATRFNIDNDGDISFYNNSGAAKFFWDASAERLGIGTSSPSAPLTVNSGSNNLVGVFESSDTLSYISFKDSNTTSDTSIALGASGNNFTVYTGTSFGIERMRIDSAGNVLVGKTSADNTTTGCRVRGDGFASFVRSGAEPALINRLTNDGSLLTLQKGGATVGSIGAKDGDIYLGTGDTGLRFYDDGDAIYPAQATNGAGRDAAVDLGNTGKRFKDLYLSGSARASSFVDSGNTNNYLDSPTSSVFRLNGSSGFVLSANGSTIVTGNSDGIDVTGTTTVTTGENAWAFKATSSGATNYSGLWFTGTTARLLLRDGSGNIKTMLAANGTNSENVINGNTIWHAGNDGSGSGLDADTLDGVQASSFVRSDADDEKTGHLKLRNNAWLWTQYSSAHDEVRINANTTGGLDVYNQTDAGFAFINASAYNVAGTGIGLSTSGSYAPTFYDSNNTGNYLDSPSSSIFRLNGSTAVNLAVGGSTKLTATTTGVGIGTSSPSNTLTVSGTVQVEEAEPYIQLKDTNATADNKYRRIYNSNQNLYISRRNDDESLQANDLTIGSSGNVGIGTSSPNYELSVHDSSANADSRIHLTNADTGTGTGDGFQIIMNGANLGRQVNLLNREASPMAFWTSNTERMRIDSSGSVTANVDLRAPIFYDSNNTAYYVDPNSTGLSLSSNGIVSSGTGVNGGFQNRTYTGGRNRIWSFGNADGYGISYFQGGPDYIGLHVSGNPTQANSDFWVSSAGISQTSQSSRAPIFYDSDNTAYYVNPNGTSVLSNLNATGTGHVFGSSSNVATTVTLRATNTAGAPAHTATLSFEGYEGRGQGTFHTDVSYAGQEWFSGIPYASGFSVFQIGYDAAGGQAEYGANSIARFTNAGDFQMGTTTVIDSSRNFYGATFYDSDNTGYYVNPLNTSVMNVVTIGGSGGGYISRNPGSQLGSMWIAAGSNGTGGGNTVVLAGGNVPYVMADQGGTSITGDLTPSGTLYLDNPNNSSTNDPNIDSKGELTSGTAYSYHALFKDGNGVIKGRITHNQYGAQFSNLSDYRAKEDYQEVENATSRLMSIPVRNFQWIGSDLRTDGFLAHEIAEVVPEAVVGEKDAVLEDGTPDYQSIDQSKIVPLLVKTIQELEARITALENA